MIRVNYISRPGMVVQVDVRQMPEVLQLEKRYNHLLVTEDLFSSWTNLMPMATAAYQEIGDTLAMIYNDPCSGGPPATIAKRKDKTGAEIIANMLSNKLHCRVDYTGDFVDNANSKRNKKFVWSRVVRKVVKSVMVKVTGSRNNWINVLACVESALNTSTYFKDVDGKSPFEIQFGVPSCRQTRDPYQADGICDKVRENVITRAIQYCQEARAVEVCKAVSLPVTETEHLPEHDYSISTRSEQHAPRGRDKQGTGILGLRNHGNACYINSLLQALASARADEKYDILAGEETSTTNTLHNNHPWQKMMSLMRQLCTLVQMRKVLKPRNQIESIKCHFTAFTNSRQQDTWEFFSAVMQYERCPSCDGNSCRLLNRLFGVSLANKSECPCEHTHVGGFVEQHYLEVDLPDAMEPTTLQDAVDSTFSPIPCELVCSECGNQSQRMQQILITASSVLVLRVKRWSAPSGLKTYRHIEFNIGQTLQVTATEELIEYELKAAVIHRGTTCTNGHYTAVLNVDGLMYLADDQHTQPISTLNRDDYQQCYMFVLEKKSE
ncbi:ubiquitin carboxyl-terminal hydrolase 17-like protein 6 [Branchiostoma floridae x Branchiostoma belcheri]